MKHPEYHTQGADPKPAALRTTIRRIAAATNFSEAADAALRRAAQLCSVHGAELHLIHVMSRRDALAPDASETEAAAARLREAAALLAREFRTTTIETHLETGVAAQRIGEVARAVGADTVVMGSSRRGLLAEVLSTSAPLRVLGAAEVPVLAVTGPVVRPYSRMVLATDLAPMDGRAGRFARLLVPDAALLVFHAFETMYGGLRHPGGMGQDMLDRQRKLEAAEAMKQLRLFARGASLENDAVLRVNAGHPALWIREQSSGGGGTDLVVLRPSKRWFTSGVTDHLLSDPPCDLLLAP